MVAICALKLLTFKLRQEAVVLRKLLFKDQQWPFLLCLWPQRVQAGRKAGSHCSAHLRRKMETLHYAEDQVPEEEAYAEGEMDREEVGEERNWAPALKTGRCTALRSAWLEGSKASSLRVSAEFTMRLQRHGGLSPFCGSPVAPLLN